MTSIRDIAKRAGASLATVSRVINNSGYVSAETRARVDLAISELQYTPNAGARSMRSGASRMVGVVLPALDVDFFGILAHTIEQELFARGYQALICCTDESVDQEARYISTLLAQRVDGVLAVSVLADATQYSRITAANIPVVAIDRDLPEVTSVSIKADHSKGGQMIAAHLLDLSHRAIAIIGAPEHSPPVMARVAGVVAELAARGVQPLQIQLARGHDFETCHALALRVLTQSPRPTAIVGTTDIAAIAAVHAAISLGFRVPQDISVIGFDDLPAARFVVPALTTVAQPIRELGAIAVAQLCTMMAGQPPNPPSPEQLQLRLIVRGTTAVAKTV